MKINSAFFTPVNITRGIINAFRFKKPIKLSQKEICEKQMIRSVHTSLNIRVIPFMLPTACIIPGILSIIFLYHDKPIFSTYLSAFITPSIILFTLSFTSLFLNFHTGRFLQKLVANTDHIAIAYRYLITKKRNFIYLTLASIFISSGYYNTNNWVHFIIAQLLSIVLAYIPLIKIHNELIRLKNIKHPLAFLNILNPQYFNRFQSIKSTQPFNDANVKASFDETTEN
ncbi:hypothetical protein D3C76_257090 [compost metagenome]